MLFRRTTCFSILAALIVGTFGTGTPAHPIAASETRPMDARLVPEKTTIVLGEPIFVSYIIRNASHQKALAPMSGGRFSFFAVRTDGLKAMPLPHSLYSECCGMTCLQEIKAGASTTYERFLPDELPITQPGTYTLTCHAVLDIEALDSNGTPHRRSAQKPTSTQASVILTVLPPDRARMGEIIARLGRAALAVPAKREFPQSDGVDCWQSADRAVQALCAISDTQAVSWLTKALHRPDGTCRVQALEALGRFNDASAFAAVKWAAHVRAVDVRNADITGHSATEEATCIRAAAADTLAKSPYSGALPCLWTLRHDADPDVRQVVMSAAMAHRDASTTAILQEISRHDPYPSRRNEARAELKYRGAK